MVELLCKIFDFLLSKYALYLVVMMGVIIMFTNTILMLVKKPIKKLTAKIANEKLRKLANKMFILFSFGISAIVWFALSKISSYYFPFEEIKVLLTGAFSTVIYAFGDGIINTSKAKDLIEDITKIEETDSEGNVKHDVEDYWKKIK